MSRIVHFGELLMRLSSPSKGLLLQDPAFDVAFCGAEMNAATALAGFGHSCAAVTVLPENEIGLAALADLRKFDLDVAHIARTEGRMGLYFLSAGAMARPSRIIYDRAHSAFSSIDADSFDWSTILDGADWLYVSGITAALGDGPLEALRKAISVARSRKVKIAFDSNYRPALWRGREALAAEILGELALKADLLFAGRRAISMMVGRTFDNPQPESAFFEAAQAFFEFSPRTNYVAATRRDVLASDRHELTSLIATRSQTAFTETVLLDGIVDRIGTGDAFGSAILHGIMAEKSLQDTAEFALAAARWSHSIRGDYLQATLDDIESLITGGGGDVRR